MLPGAPLGKLILDYMKELLFFFEISFSSPRLRSTKIYDEIKEIIKI